MNVLPHGPASGELQLNVRQREVPRTEGVWRLNWRVGGTLAINVGYDGSWKDMISNQIGEFCADTYVFPELHRGGHSRLREITMMQWVASPLNQSYSLRTRMPWARPWEAQTERARGRLMTIKASVNRNRM